MHSSRNTWLCVHWQWNTLEWCQLNALQASPVVHLVTPLSCVSLSMNTQPSVPAIGTFSRPCGIHWSPLDSPHKGPVTRSFGVLFDVRLNKRLRTEWSYWCFETPWHLNVTSQHIFSPTPRVIWRDSRGIALPLGTRQTEDARGTELRITRLFKEDEGIYTCLGSQQGHESDPVQLSLQVQGMCWIFGCGYECVGLLGYKICAGDFVSVQG